MMQPLCIHQNVGGVLLLSLGCESFKRCELSDAIAGSGRPVKTLVIQESGGTRKSIEQGRVLVEELLARMAGAPRAPLEMREFIVGTICGGSDATSGITANPGVGRAFDRLVQGGASGIFEETNELIGCETIMAQRAVTPELGTILSNAVVKAAAYHKVLGHGSFATGNAEIAELIACGSHVILFTTGRGSVVGLAISPVIKVCANPDTYRRMSEDMDVDAGKILEGRGTLDSVGSEIFDLSLAVARGARSKSEALLHQEFVLTYKSIEPIGPACLPRV